MSWTPWTPLHIIDVYARAQAHNCIRLIWEEVSKVSWPDEEVKRAIKTLLRPVAHIARSDRTPRHQFWLMQLEELLVTDLEKGSKIVESSTTSNT